MRRPCTSATLAIGFVLAGCGSAPDAPRERPTVGASSAPLRIVEVPRVAPSTQSTAAKVDSPPNATGEGWTMFQGNAARTGATSRPTIQKPRISWKAKVGVMGWLNTPLIAGNTVIVPSSGTTHNRPDAMDGVYGLDLRTGAQTFFVHTDLDANGATVDGDRVFVTADDGYLYAIDLAGPKVAWKERGSGRMYSHPLVVRAGDKHVVVVGDASGALRGYDAATGAEVFRVQLSGEVRGGASWDGKSIYATSQGGEIVALTPTGKVLWKVAGPREPATQSIELLMEIYAAPTVVSGLVIVPFARDTVYPTPALVALDARSGSEVWRAAGDGAWYFGNLRSSPAVAGDKLVFSETYSGDIAAVRISDGALVYRTTLGPCYFPQWASPVVVGTTAYVPRFDGSVYAVTAATGAFLWELNLRGSKTAGQSKVPGACSFHAPGDAAIYASLAIAGDGTIIAGTGEGFVYAVGP